MSTIRANSITNSAGTGAPDFPNGITAATIPAANLTGTLPSIDGSALTNLPGSYTLLGTITTTSGTTQTLSGLTLTGYVRLVAVFNGVSHASGTASYTFAGCTITGSVAAGGQYRGLVEMDLATGSGTSLISSITNAAPASSATGQYFILRTNTTTASTSVSITVSASTFSAGSINIYGVK